MKVLALIAALMFSGVVSADSHKPAPTDKKATATTPAPGTPAPAADHGHEEVKKAKK